MLAVRTGPGACPVARAAGSPGISLTQAEQLVSRYFSTGQPRSGMLVMPANRRHPSWSILYRDGSTALVDQRTGEILSVAAAGAPHVAEERG
jgi:hypothetical protein